MPAPAYRIAVIADIHGNLQALRAVLQELSRLGYDRLIVNGDVVNRCADSVAALETVLNTDAHFTLGNHDDLMRLWDAHSPILPAEWFADPFWDATAWTVSKLEAAGLLDTFAGWPMTQTLELPGAPRVLIAHGTPAHYREGLGRRSEPARLETLLAEGQSEVLIGSHIHSPFELTLPGGLILNTGAVGTPFNGDPRAQFLLLDLIEGRWRPGFVPLPYDQAGALSAFYASGLIPEGGLSAEVQYQELRLSRSLYTPFWDYAERLGAAKTPALWAEFQAAYPELFAPATSSA